MTLVTFVVVIVSNSICISVITSITVLRVSVIILPHQLAILV